MIFFYVLLNPTDSTLPKIQPFSVILWSVTQDSLMIGGQVIIACIQGCPDEEPFLFLTSQRLLIPEDFTWSAAHLGLLVRIGN